MKTDLVVMVVGVAATVLNEDAALAIQDIAKVTLAPLHTLHVAVPPSAGGGALGWAHRHTARVVAVGWTALDWRASKVDKVVS